MLDTNGSCPVPAFPRTLSADVAGCRVCACSSACRGRGRAASSPVSCSRRARIPAQPKAQCKSSRQPLSSPASPTTAGRGASARRSRCRPAGSALARSSRSRQDAAEGPRRAVQLRRRALLRRLPRRGGAGVPRGEDGRARHVLRDAGRRDPAPAVLHAEGRSVSGLPAERHRPAARCAASLLQRQGHQHSAERLYAQAARLRPDDDEAQVAAAVGRFDEDNLRRRSRTSARSSSGSRRARSCATTSGCCSRGRGSASRRSPSFGSRARSGRRRRSARQADCVPRRPCGEWD